MTDCKPEIHGRHHRMIPFPIKTRSMKFSIVSILALLAGFALLTSSGLPAEKSGASPQINWISIQDLNEMSQNKKWDKTGKKVFIDLYTDWCGWCKRMDAGTFSDPQVIEYMNKHFYAVKLNAETREDIVFGKNTFKYIASGRRGTNEIAIALGSVNGSLGYPTISVLDESMGKLTVSPGYKTPERLLPMLMYYAGNHYKTMSMEEFQKNVYAPAKSGTLGD